MVSLLRLVIHYIHVFIMKILKHIKLIILVSFLISSLSAFSQKEIYFNATKSEDIKVQTISGFELKMEKKFLFDRFDYSSSKVFDFNLGYFHEKQLSKSISLIGTIELKSIIGKTKKYQFVDSVSVISNNFTPYYGINLNLSLEPRWYFGYEKRFQLGKALLNSGWFLSLPVRLVPLQVSTPYFIGDNYPGVIYHRIDLDISPTLGFRQAITKNIFVEAEGSLTLNNISFLFLENAGVFSYLVPTLDIKFAYSL